MPAHKRMPDMTYAVKVARLMIRIRKAKDGARGLSLSYDEVSLLVETLRLISAKREGN